MSKALKGLKRMFYYCIGQWYILLYYDKKNLIGVDFQSKYNKVFARGWEWVYRDGMARRKKGVNTDSPFPVSEYSTVIGGKNIFFHPNDLRNFQTQGCYFQAIDAKIIIGEGTWIAPGVGLITANHNPANLSEHMPGENIVIGKKCWIGMNSIILPGVHLGDNTIVAAGAIVTKNFSEGNCVLGGNPAKIIKKNP